MSSSDMSLSDHDGSDDESDFSLPKAKSKAPKPKPATATTIPAKRGPGLAERKPNMSSPPAPPPSKKAKAAPAPPSAPAGDVESEANALGRNSAQKAQVSKKFQKLSQRDHILLRPDTYIGSVEASKQKMWVKDPQSTLLSEREITFVPGLYKIFDEILVNAADHKQRDPSMKELSVTIDEVTGFITIKNDGQGIPIEQHAVEKGIWIPELIFGHLLTGENFDDTEKRVVGGRNGYGAKLTNIFSKEFTLETCDVKASKVYRQTWKDNMSSCEPPLITPKPKDKKGYTQITFLPDYARFSMSGLDADSLALLTKRVYDMAGVTDKSVKVYLNKQEIKIASFEKYIDMYLPPPSQHAAPAAAASLDTSFSSTEGADADNAASKPLAAAKPKTQRVYVRLSDRWEVCVAVSPDGTPEQTSFVNAIATYKGGSHVMAIADQVGKAVLAHINKKNKAQAAAVKQAQIRNHLWIFVNCLIENPAFDSQTKECLTTKREKFGSSPEIPEATMAKIIKQTGIVEAVLFWATAKQMRDLKKVGGGKKAKFLDIPKLDDANLAGSKRAQECTLILTEGDSAKTLALSGISVVGRDLYGVFPLKGKLLNVRDAGLSQVTKNAEIQNLVRILGLRFNEAYESTKGLRYGHVMVMTDQDQDGSHIKGLLFNFFHHFFPSLLAIPGFVRVFVTPIVKVIKGPTTRSFFSLLEYQEWKKETVREAGAKALTKPVSAGVTKEAARLAAEAGALKAWRVKYYKGLGTNSSKEAQEYFARLKDHVIDMKWTGVPSGDALDMVFSKSRVEERKVWLSSYDAVSGPRVDFRAKELDYPGFVHGELVLFSLSDGVRSIPNVLDGLKPSQRKVLYACFKRKLTQEIKVSQLAGYVSEHAAYHHGEESLSSTLVGMAQTFVGSNNLALLTAGGAFGTRRLGGKDAASSRYIHTKLENVARVIFHPDDDALLEQLEDDGQLIEPRYYVPIVPMVLINGASGIGTGWSTEILPHSPREVIKAVRSLIKTGECDFFLPHYNGFAGIIEPEIKPKKGLTGRYFIRGVAELDGETLTISELPVGKWTAVYKEFLLEASQAGVDAKDAKGKDAKGKKDNAPPANFGKKDFPEGGIKEIKEYHTDDTVLFELELSPEFAASLHAQGHEAIMSQFQLQTTVSSSNMVAYDKDSKIAKYESARAILDAFMPVRRDLYVKRKANLEAGLEAETQKLSSQARFVQMVVDNQLVVSKRKRADLMADLARHGFPMIFKGKAAAAAEAKEDEDEESNDVPEGDPTKGYDYLLGMALWSLTLEKVRWLQDKAKAKEKELDDLKKKTPEDLWLADLDALEVMLDEADQIMSELRVEQNKQRVKAGNSRAGGKKKKRATKMYSDEESDEELDDDSDDDFVKRKPKKAAPKKKEEPAPEPKKTASGGQVTKAPPVKAFDPEELKKLVEEAKAKAAEPKPEPKPKVPKEAKPAAGAAKSKKKKKSGDSDEDDDDEEEDDDDEVMSMEAPPPLRERAPARKAAEKAKAIVDLLSEEEEDEEEDDFQDAMSVEDDEDAFEPPPAKPVKKAPPAKAIVPAKPLVASKKVPSPPPKAKSPMAVDDDDVGGFIAKMGLQMKQAAAAIRPPSPLVAVPVPPAKPKRAAAVAKKPVVEDSLLISDEEEESEFEG